MKRTLNKSIKSEKRRENMPVCTKSVFQKFSKSNMFSPTFGTFSKAFTIADIL